MLENVKFKFMNVLVQKNLLFMILLFLILNHCLKKKYKNYEFYPGQFIRSTHLAVSLMLKLVITLMNRFFLEVYRKRKIVIDNASKRYCKLDDFKMLVIK